MIPWKGIPFFEKPPFQDSNVVKTLLVSFVLMFCDVIPWLLWQGYWMEIEVVCLFLGVCVVKCVSLCTTRWLHVLAIYPFYSAVYILQLPGPIKGDSHGTLNGHPLCHSSPSLPLKCRYQKGLKPQFAGVKLNPVVHFLFFGPFGPKTRGRLWFHKGSIETSFGLPLSPHKLHPWQEIEQQGMSWTKGGRDSVPVWGWGKRANFRRSMRSQMAVWPGCHETSGFIIPNG